MYAAAYAGHRCCHAPTGKSRRARYARRRLYTDARSSTQWHCGVVEALIEGGADLAGQVNVAQHHCACWLLPWSCKTVRTAKDVEVAGFATPALSKVRQGSQCRNEFHAGQAHSRNEALKTMNSLKKHCNSFWSLDEPFRIRREAKRVFGEYDKDHSVTCPRRAESNLMVGWRSVPISLPKRQLTIPTWTVNSMAQLLAVVVDAIQKGLWLQALNHAENQ